MASAAPRDARAQDAADGEAEPRRHPRTDAPADAFPRGADVRPDRALRRRDHRRHERSRRSTCRPGLENRRRARPSQRRCFSPTRTRQRLDTLVLCNQMADYFDTGPGKQGARPRQRTGQRDVPRDGGGDQPGRGLGHGLGRASARARVREEVGRRAPDPLLDRRPPVRALPIVREPVRRRPVRR